MRIFALVLCSLLVLLAACAPQPPARQTPPAASMPRNPLQEPVTPRPIVGTPAAPDQSCTRDSDCTVKNVGNCCGYYPGCVNVNARTDPQAVQAQCAKSGTASVCGFPVISGCRCVAKRCVASSEAAAL